MGRPSFLMSPWIMGRNQKRVLGTWWNRHDATLSVPGITALTRRLMREKGCYSEKQVEAFTEAVARGVLRKLANPPHGHQAKVESAGFDKGLERFRLTAAGAEWLIKRGSK